MARLPSVAVGIVVAEEETVVGEAYKAAFAPVRNDP
jgi:hypothetical protein